MKLINSSTFQTVMKNLGILPNLGWANTGTKATLNTYINNYAATVGAMPIAADGYNKDAFVELTTNLQIAKQIGNIAAFNTILTQLRSRLQDWLVSNDADFNRYFAYSPLFNHMSHYPNGFGSSGTFVDAHFHVGYIINAAAILARYDATFVTNYGRMVETVIRSIANETKDMVDPGSNGTVKPWFPYLKYFDPYAGHSWANAKADDQESVSEAIHFATGVLLWGEASSVVTGSFVMRDLGALLYVTESEAARQYWWDVDGAVNGAPYANAYTHRHLTMLYSWGGNYATFFGTEPEYIHGITYVPLSGASTWLGTNVAGASNEYSQIGQNYAGWGGWGQDINGLQTTFNATAAIAAFNTNNGLWSADKYAFTYHWDHTFDSVGVIDPTVQADITAFQVFVKGPCKHYMIYMPPGKGPKTVTFTDGKAFLVPNDTVIVYKDCPTLPLTIVSFTANSSDNKSVQLEWKTASETNIHSFVLEVSKDGVQWSKINFQPATGNASQTATYHFTDYKPSNGINYYRLQIRENDNTFYYSEITSININNLNTQIHVYPNPTEDKVYIDLIANEIDTANIHVYDMLGRELLTPISITLQEGVNIIPIELASLSSGSYILHLKTKSGKYFGDYKIVKK